MSSISDKLLQQRLRNRIMEVLDGFADEETIEAVGTDELIEQWYDYMDEKRMYFYSQPVFSHDELNALKRFHYLLESTYLTIPTTWSLKDLVTNKYWSTLVATAREELLVFQQRGFLDEEHEIT